MRKSLIARVSVLHKNNHEALSCMLSLITALFLAGVGHSSSLEPLQLRSLSTPECGTDYQITRREACGDESYFSCANRACPGYQPEEIFTTEEEGDLDCTDARSCNEAAKGIAGSACTQPVGFGPTVLVSWQLKGTTVVARCKYLETIKSCDIKACGVSAYKPCQDLTKPYNKTCSLLLTRGELDEYIASVKRDASDKSLEFILNKSVFLSAIKREKSQGCFIKKYDGIKQFEGVVVALKIQFKDTYGFAYDGLKYSCDDETAESEEVSFRNVQCSALSSDDIQTGLGLSSTDIEALNFYTNCGLQRTYKIPEQWLRFNLSEITRLLTDLVAKNDPAVKVTLDGLKAKLEKSKVPTLEGN